MGQPQIVITNTAPTSDNLITDSKLSASTGAAMIGIADAGGYYTASTVEGALQEIQTDVSSSYLKLDQTIPQTTVGQLHYPTATFGGSSNNTEFEADGTVKFNGTATVFVDELGDLIKAAGQNPASKLVWDYPEGTLDFKDTCDLNTYAVMNVQLNHDWKFGSAIEPHIHWFQNQNETPNWLLGYRWQSNGYAKTTAWTYMPWDNNVVEYVEGTIVQITSFRELEAPGTYGISDILQFRIFRDTANDSEELTELDPYVGNAEALSFDIHIEVDTIGSRQRYTK